MNLEARKPGMGVGNFELSLENALLLNFAWTRLVVKRVGREYHPDPAPDVSL
jgi:hypothetical protein